MLLGVVEMFQQNCEYEIVEPAHMELAEPTIEMAFDRCVERGARRVVVFPYFLLPGRHWAQDIPQLAGEAAKKHDGVEYLVTSPLGIHSSMGQIINDRIAQCLGHTVEGETACSICEGTDHCQMKGGTSE